MQQGRFVPDELLLPLMIPAILAAGPIVFLDGMPRTMEQLIALRGLDETNLQFIWLQASHKICLDRALGRNREDDAESTLRERLAAYRLQTIPTLTAAASGSCVIRVDVSGSREKAFRAFLRAVMAIFPEDKKDIQELLQSLKV
jgi:adenylate kinase